jgi:precorrin-6A synthase
MRGPGNRRVGGGGVVREILIISMGAGDPEQITVQAINALNRVDVILVPDKGMQKAELVGLREEVCRRYLTARPYRIVELPDPDRDRTAPAYQAAVEDWHGRRAELFEQAILREVPPDGCGAFLVWGDPSLYDSITLIIRRILDRGRVSFGWSVIPGVTSVQALAAKHRLVLNRIGAPVRLTTGRRLAASVEGDETVVVMLDGSLACQRITDPDVEIYWGANVGTPDEQLRAGRLVEVIDEISRTRAELRERVGWVMDTYVLRRAQ